MIVQNENVPSSKDSVPNKYKYPFNVKVHNSLCVSTHLNYARKK